MHTLKQSTKSFYTRINKRLLLKTLYTIKEQAYHYTRYTVDSRYLEFDWTLWNTSRYPYFDISDVQNWGKYQSNNQISQMNM